MIETTSILLTNGCQTTCHNAAYELYEAHQARALAPLEHQASSALEKANLISRLDRLPTVERTLIELLICEQASFDELVFISGQTRQQVAVLLGQAYALLFGEGETEWESKSRSSGGSHVS